MLAETTIAFSNNNAIVESQRFYIVFLALDNEKTINMHESIA